MIWIIGILAISNLLLWVSLLEAHKYIDQLQASSHGHENSAIDLCIVEEGARAQSQSASSHHIATINGMAICGDIDESGKFVRFYANDLGRSARYPDSQRELDADSSMLRLAVDARLAVGGR